MCHLKKFSNIKIKTRVKYSLRHLGLALFYGFYYSQTFLWFSEWGKEWIKKFLLLSVPNVAKKFKVIYSNLQ